MYVGIGVTCCNSVLQLFSVITDFSCSEQVLYRKQDDFIVSYVERVIGCVCLICANDRNSINKFIKYSIFSNKSRVSNNGWALGHHENK